MAAAAAAVAMMGYQALSGMAQSDLIKHTGAIQRRINDMNAEWAELDAYEAEKDGIVNANRYQNQVNQTLGAQKVAFAVQDVDTSYGTAAEVVAESKLSALLNTTDLLRQGRMRALGFKREAGQIRLNGQMGQLQSEINASATQAAAFAGAASTGVSSGVLTGSSGYSRK